MYNFRLDPDRITARAIAAEAGANLASITYHFGSKDNLVTRAVIAGLDRWLADIAQRLDGVAARTPLARFRLAAAAVEESRARHTGLARNFVGALAKGQHDRRLRALLAKGFRDTRPNLAAVLGLGDDQAAHDAAGLILSLFHGMLIQALLDPALTIDGDRMHEAQIRLRTVLPNP